MSFEMPKTSEKNENYEDEVNGIKFQVGRPYSDPKNDYEIYFPGLSGKGHDQVIRFSKSMDDAKKVFEYAQEQAEDCKDAEELYKLVDEYCRDNIHQTMVLEAPKSKEKNENYKDGAEINGIKFKINRPYSDPNNNYEIYFPDLNPASQIIPLSRNTEYAKKVFEYAREQAKNCESAEELYKLVDEYNRDNI
ncbi:MAG: hypothetical protein WC459_03225 [Patescibacteria group bacterium]